MTTFFDEAFLRKLERLSLLSRKSAASDSQGERRSARRGGSVEFADYRPYVPGDDFRRIDWNAYARLERFFIKLFVEEQDITLHLLIDASASMDWGNPNKLDYAIRVAASIGYIALLGLDRVTASVLDGSRYAQRLPALRGKARALELFNFLAAFRPRNTNPESTPLAKQSINWQYALAEYAADHTPGPTLLLSDLMNDGWKESVNALAGRGYDVTVLQILAPDEIDPEFRGDFKLRDSETGDTVEITADVESIDRYRQGLDAWQNKWRQFAHSRRAGFITISTDLPLEELLFTQLRSQGVLR